MKLDHKNIAYKEVKFVVLYKYCEGEYAYFYQSFESDRTSKSESGQWNIYPYSKLIYKNK